MEGSFQDAQEDMEKKTHDLTKNKSTSNGEHDKKKEKRKKRHLSNMSMGGAEGVTEIKKRRKYTKRTNNEAKTAFVQDDNEAGAEQNARAKNVAVKKIKPNLGWQLIMIIYVKIMSQR